MSSRTELNKSDNDINFNNPQNDKNTEYGDNKSAGIPIKTDNKNEDSFIDNIMHIVFLGVGASSLSIVKVPYYIALIFTVIFIGSIGFANIYFSYYTLVDIIDENENKKYIIDEKENKEDIKDIIDKPKKEHKRSIKNKKNKKEEEREDEEEEKENKEDIKDIIDKSKKEHKRSIKNKKNKKEEEREDEEEEKEDKKDIKDIIDKPKKGHKRSIKNKKNKKEEEKKENIEEEKRKKREEFFKEICNILDTFNIPYIIGEIIIHQILIYRSLGGIFNIIGEFNYDSVFMFLSDTYWRKLSMKFVANIIIFFLLLYPLCLKMDAKAIESFPIIGFNIILFIVLSVFFQFFYYFINYCITEFNYRDLSYYPNKREFPFKFFQSLSIFFFCYSGHNGFINKIPNEKLKKPEIIREEFRYANILSMVIYFIFSCLGFLSVPKDVVDIVTEKKRFWDKDIIMTISRILLLPFCLFKIMINFDKLRNIWFCNKEKIDDKLNAIFTFVVLSITCACASLYQNIVGYITIIGGFFVPMPTFLIPHIKLKQHIQKEYKRDFQNLRISFGVFLCLLGITGGILGINDIFKGDL